MKTSSCLATASLALLLTVGNARAGIQIHGSTTAYTTTDKDWLSHTTEDIDANGLGTAGWLFFGNFDGVAEASQPLTHRVESLPSYITAVVAGANFLSVADEYDTEGPGFGIIDDPTTLDGSDARSGALVADGGVAGDSLEILSFTVSGLTTPVRVGILSGTEQRADGRWDPTSITLSDGVNSATVGDHTTNPLPFVPDSVTPNNVGWVFFDIDADGTYTISATKRLATQGVSIGGLTFDNTPPETFTFNATFDQDFLYGPNWSGSNGGTATPGNMGAADTYVVPVNALLLGPATLSGNLVVNPAATLTMATGSQIGGTGIATVNGQLKTSAGGTATIGAALVLNNTAAPGRVLDIVAGSVLQNTGNISLQAGEALVSGTWNHNQFPLSVRRDATLLGDGILGGSLQVWGGLNPGPESGTGDLTVQGYLAFIPGSTMEIEVAGSGAGQFDRVLSSGTAELAGALVVDFSDRPLAEAGTYTFLTYGGKALSFSSVTPVGLAAGIGFAFDAATQAQFTITAAPSQTFTFDAAVDSDYLDPANWSGVIPGLATPASPRPQDIYLVAADAVLSGTAAVTGSLTVNAGASLTVDSDGLLTVNAGVTLTVAASGILTLNGGADVVIADTGTLSNFGTVTCLAGTNANPTTLLTGINGGVVNQVGGIFTRAGSFDNSILGGHFTNHGAFDESGGLWAELVFDNSATGTAIIRASFVDDIDTDWNNAGYMTAYSGIGYYRGSGYGYVDNSGTLNLPKGSTSNFGTTLENSGTLNAAGILGSVDNTGIVNLTGAAEFHAESTPSGGDFINRAIINQGDHSVTILCDYGKAVRNQGTWTGSGKIDLINRPTLALEGGTLTNNGSWAFSDHGSGTGGSIEVGGTLAGSAPLAIPATASLSLTGGDLANTVTTAAPVSVTAGSTISGSLTLDAPTLTVNAGVTLTVAASGILTLNGRADVVIADTGTLSNFGTVTCLAGTFADPTTLLTGINGGVVNQVGGIFTRAGSFDNSILGGHFTNHGAFDESGGLWAELVFDNSATGTAIIRASFVDDIDTDWNNAGYMTAYSGIGYYRGSGYGYVDNSGTLNLPKGSTSNFGTTLENSGTLNAAGILGSVDNTGIVNLTGAAEFHAESTPSGGDFINRAIINQGDHSVTISCDYGKAVRNQGTWTGSGKIDLINRPTLALEGGTLTNNGSWAFSDHGRGTGGSIEVGGTLAGSAPLAIPATASLSLTGGDLANTVTTAGPVSVTAGSTISGSLTLVDTDITGSNLLSVSGKLGAAGSGTSTVACDLSLSNPTGQVLEVAPGATLETTGAALSFSSGQASVRGVWNHHRPALQARGTVVGDGTIIGTTNFWNRVEPGPAGGIGDLTVDGNANLVSASAKLVIDAAGLGTGEFDRLVVTGNANFTTASSLEIDFSPRPRAVPGVYFCVVATTHSNSFGTQTPLALDASRSFAYDPANPGQFAITSTATPYEDWATASGLTTGVNDDPLDDANLDGVLNIQHFAFDTHPLTSDGSHEGKRRVRYLDVGGTDYASITFPVRKGAGFAGSPGPSATVDGFIYSIQGTADLSAWTESVSEVTPADSAGLPELRDLDGDGTPDWEYRTFILDDPTQIGGFLRVGVEAVP